MARSIDELADSSRRELTHSQKKAFEKIMGVWMHRTPCSCASMTQMLESAGYEVKVNGNNHAQIYRKDGGTKVIGKSNIPLTYPPQRGDLPRYYVRRVLGEIITDLQNRYDL